MSGKALNLQGDVMSIADVILCTLTDVSTQSYFGSLTLGMDVTFQPLILSYIVCSLIKLVCVLGLSVFWHLYFIT